jgi:hypothetical protein
MTKEKTKTGTQTSPQTSPLSKWRGAGGEVFKSEDDKWRKRLIAAISHWACLVSYLPESGADTDRSHRLTVIKAVACQASGYDNFNRIPLERLRSLYYAFVNKAKDHKNVRQFTGNLEDTLSFLN